MQQGTGSPTGPGSGHQRDWTQGNIFKNLLSLSWPMMISQSLNMMGPTIDMIWVGRLGSASIAGVGVGGMAVMMITALMMGLSMGARAMIARFIGAGDQDGARHIARQAFIVSTGFAAILVPAGIIATKPLLIFLGLEPDVVDEGTAYMRIMLVGAAFMTFRTMIEGIMQASGDAVTPMKVAALFRIIHIVLAPFLIFGWWIFPQMGVSGAAVADVVSQSIGLGVGLWFLFSGKTRLHLTMKGFSVDPSILWRIIRIGIPTSLTGMQRGMGQLTLMWFIVPFGTLAVAGHTLVQRVEMFIMMPGMGMGLGTSTLVGQNLGAGHPGRAEKSGWMAVIAVESFMLLMSTGMLLWAEEILSIFGPPPEVVTLGAAFLRIAAVGFLLFGIEPVLMMALSGAGDTLPPMLATMLSFWAVQVPLAYVLTQYTELGVYGVRWGMATGMIAAAASMAIYFRLGRWKRKRV